MMTKNELLEYENNTINTIQKSNTMKNSNQPRGDVQHVDDAAAMCEWSRCTQH